MHVNDHYFQTSFSLIQLRKTNSMRSLLWKELHESIKNKNDLGHGHMPNGRHLQFFSSIFETRNPIILNLGMNHQGLKAYKVYITDVSGLVLTYFKAMSNLFKIAHRAYTRPIVKSCERLQEH